MNTKADRDINKLNPEFKKKVILFLNEVNKYNKVIFISEWFRTKERQMELFRMWYSQVLHSNHQDWLAIDIWFYWDELYPKDYNRWRVVADIAKKYNIEWWFDLWDWDKPHFQDNWLPLLNPNKPKQMSNYTEQMNSILKDNSLSPIFSTHEWDKVLTEKEVKELIEIAIARLRIKLK